MSHKHRVKLYTWFNGQLFKEEHEADSLEAAKQLARSRGPHSFKIYNEIDELVHSELLDGSTPQVPDYA
jgi:hypothetical protein